MKKNVNKIINDHSCILAFFISCIIHLLILSYSEFLGGRYSIVDGDSINIYIPAIRQFWRDIISGNSIFYSWTNSYGMNTVAYNAYNVYSIFNLFYLFFYNSDVQVVTCLVVIMKAGVAAAFFDMYLEKIFKAKGISALIPSICYAASSYVVAYTYINFIWLDAVFLLPIILLYIHKLIDGEKALVLIPAYSYLFVSNFYMAYMVGIFSAVYYCLVIVLKNKSVKEILGKSLKYFLYVVLSVGLSAIILLPTAMFIFNQNPDDSTKDMVLNLAIWDVFNQLYIGQYQAGSIISMPYVYCGIFVMLFLPSYFFSKCIRKKEKILIGVLLLVMTISLVIDKLNVFWHAFDVPDGWWHRFSFIISFLLCVIISRQLKYLRYANMKVLLYIGLACMALYGVLGVVAANNPNTYLNTNTVQFACVNLLFFVVYIVAFVAYKKRYWVEKFKQEFAVGFIALVVIELVVNGCAFRFRFEDYQNVARSESIDTWVSSNNEYLKGINDDSLYRIDCISDYTYNGDTYFGYNGLADFETIENPVLRGALDKIGIGTSVRVTNEFGTSDFARMLLGVKYKVKSVSFNPMLFQEQHAMVEQFPYYASMGFLVDDVVLDYQFESDNSFENINSLASVIAGKECEIYEIKNFQGAQIQEEGISCYIQDGKIVFEAVDKAASEKAVIIRMPQEERKAYIQIDCGPSVNMHAAPFLLFGPENAFEMYGRVGIRYIKEMIPDGETCFTEMLMTDYTYQRVAANGVYIAYYNEDAMQEAYDAIKDDTFVIDEYKDGYVHGNISIEKDNQVLYLSIPYDDGWSATVNGDKKEIKPILGDAFMGIELGKGDYEIELKYNPPYVKVGGAISLISLIVYVTMFFIERKRIKIVKKVK